MRISLRKDLARQWQQYLGKSCKEYCASIPQKVLEGPIALVKRFVYEPPVPQIADSRKPSCVMCHFPASQAFTLHHRVEKRGGMCLGFADTPYVPTHFLVIPKNHGLKVPRSEEIEAAIRLLRDLAPCMRGHINIAGSSASIREHIHVQAYDTSGLPSRTLPIERAQTETLLEAETVRLSLLDDRRWPTGAIVVESPQPRTVARWTRHFISVLEEERVAYNLVLTPARVYIVPRIAEDVPRRIPFPEPLQGKGIGGLEVAGVFIAEQKAMFDCLTRDAYWRLLQATAYSQADVRNWIQSIRSRDWLRPHVSRYYGNLLKTSKVSVSQALAARSPQIVVGIPFVAGTDRTLPNVVTTIAKGFRRYYPELPALILPVGEADAESCLSRLTKQAAPDSSARCLTVVPTIKNSSLLRGKGWSVRLVLEIARSLNAHLMLFDADLITRKTVSGGAVAGLSADWIRTLLGPVIHCAVDFVAPGYQRHYQEARLTNPIVFPLFSALYGINIRQPIGGEFAISKSFVSDLCGADEAIWFGPVGGYGIDVWLTANAAKSRAVNISRLGVKLQDMKPVLGHQGMLKDVFMFEQVVSTLFAQAMRDWADICHNGNRRLREIKHSGPENPPIRLDEYPVDKGELLALAQNCGRLWPVHECEYKSALLQRDYKSYRASIISTTADWHISDRCWARTLFRYLLKFKDVSETSAGRQQIVLRGLANLYSAYLVSYLSCIKREKEKMSVSDEELSVEFVEHRVMRLRDAFVREKKRILEDPS